MAAVASSAAEVEGGGGGGGGEEEEEMSCSHTEIRLKLFLVRTLRRKTAVTSQPATCHLCVCVCVCVNVYSLEKMLRYRNFIWSNYRFSDPGFD
jgi:hypothetical protein